MNFQKIVLGFCLGLGLISRFGFVYADGQDVNLITAKPDAASVLAAPILSYQEAAAATELKRVTDWMTMPASNQATGQFLSDGKVLYSLPNKPISITKNQVGLNKSYDLSAQAMQRGLPVDGMTNSDALKSKANLYQNYVDYFSSDANGDPTKLGALNIANILQADIIPEGTLSRDAINLLVDPFPEKISAVPNRNSTVVEKENFAQKLTGQALLSVSMNALADMIARRTPPSSTTGTTPQSMMQVMRNEAETRTRDNQWVLGLAGLSQEALLREIAYMQAMQLQLQYQQYRLNEQAVSLLAVVASAQARLGPLVADLAKQMNQSKIIR